MGDFEYGFFCLFIFLGDEGTHLRATVIDLIIFFEGAGMQRWDFMIQKRFNRRVGQIIV